MHLAKATHVERDKGVKILEVEEEYILDLKEVRLQSLEGYLNGVPNHRN